MIEAAAEIPEVGQLETTMPVIATPNHHVSEVVVEEASSLNLSEELGAIKGIRPEIPATGAVPVKSGVDSPAAIGKHLAVMAGNSFPEGAN